MTSCRLVERLRKTPRALPQRGRSVLSRVVPSLDRRIDAFLDHHSTSLSDSREHLAYRELCEKAARDDAVFSSFRSAPCYRLVVETLSEEQGQQYADMVLTDSSVMSMVEDYRKNDDFGGPKRFEYPGLGSFSPVTLRYIKTLSDLEHHFGFLDGMRICEIGPGFGGQCRIIYARFKPSDYYLVDLEPVLALCRRYLSEHGVADKCTYMTMGQLGGAEVDLFISNYAFTEMKRSIQDEYLEKVVLRSKRGYICYNEIASPDFRSYKRDQLLSIIPGSRILAEVPLTHPRNCIIVWGDKG